MHHHKIIVWNLKKLKLEIVNFTFYLREINFKVRIDIGKTNLNLSLINPKIIVRNPNFKYFKVWNSNLNVRYLKIKVRI